MYTTLLWATDGSPEADLALSEALELLTPGGRIIAFHCDQRFIGGRSGGAPVLADELDRRRRVEKQVEELRSGGVDAELFVETTVMPRRVRSPPSQRQPVSTRSSAAPGAWRSDRPAQWQRCR